MSVTREEVSAKLNLDTSTLATAKRELAEFSQHGHLGFLHASNGAKEFHKALHGLSEQMPILGTAMRALFTKGGIANMFGVGSLIAAPMAFTAITDKLKELNKEMDEIGKRNAESSGLSVEETRKLANEQDASQAKFNSWFNELHTIKEEQTKILEREIDANERVYQSELKRIALTRELSVARIGLGAMTGAILPADAQAQLIAAQRKAENDQHAAERKRLVGEVGATDASLKAAQAGAATFERTSKSTHELLEQDKAKQARLQQMFDNETKAEPQQYKDVNAWGLDIGSATSSADAGWKNKLKRFGKAVLAAGTGIPGAQWFAGQKAVRESAENDRLENQHAERLRNLNKEIQDNNKLIDQRTEAERVGKEKAQEFNQEIDNFTDKNKKAKEALKQFDATPTKRDEAPAATSPLSMSMQQLASYNTPYGRVAREIQRRRALAEYQVAAGFPDQAKQTLQSISGYDEEYQEYDMSGKRVQGKYGLYPALVTKKRHIDGLMNLLPEGLTEEQNQQQRTKELIDSIMTGFNGPGLGLPVVLKDNQIQ